jgi:hypothetical protein
MMQVKAQPLECPYITDGLVFWLDGINKGKSSAGWQDLISKNVFPWIARTTQGENCVIFGSGSEAMVNRNVPIFGTNSTIEGCCSGSSNSKWQIVFIQDIMMLARDNTGKQLTFKTKRTGGRFNATVPTTFTASANDNMALVNGVKSTTIQNSDWSAVSGTSIGSRSAYPYVGNVHSIRVYNRLLTEEEMLFNQQVDNERFNLGLEL